MLITGLRGLINTVSRQKSSGRGYARVMNVVYKEDRVLVRNGYSGGLEKGYFHGLCKRQLEGPGIQSCSRLSLAMVFDLILWSVKEILKQLVADL